MERLDDAVEEGRSDQPDARTHEVFRCCEGMPDPDEEALVSGEQRQALQAVVGQPGDHVLADGTGDDFTQQSPVRDQEGGEQRVEVMHAGRVEASREEPGEVRVASLDATRDLLLRSAFPIDVDAHLAARKPVDVGREDVDEPTRRRASDGQLERDRRDGPALLASLRADRRSGQRCREDRRRRG